MCPARSHCLALLGLLSLRLLLGPGQHPALESGARLAFPV